MLIGALVAHHPHTTHGAQQDGSCLPHLVVETFAIITNICEHVLNVDIIGFLEYADSLAGDIAKDAHRQTRAREWMSLDETVGHAQLATHTAHLVLEQPLKRLAQLQVHFLGQSAHIMMTLDSHACDGQALDAVGVDGSLCQPTGIRDFVRLGIEHLDKVASDDFAFLLGVGHTRQVGKELVAGIYANHVQP